jgi:hypothetical protein
VARRRSSIALATFEMSPDTTEPAIAERASDLAVATPALAVRVGGERETALRDTWRALWSSRLLIWVVGIGTIATTGFGPVRHAFDPPGITRGFGALGNLLVAPAARWDAAWYLVIAHYGYRPELGPFTQSRAAFFPLYPLGVRVLADLGAAPVVAGVLVSMAALAAGLYGLHRLVSLEAGRLRPRAPRRAARLAVLLTAFAPMAFFFSAIYSESLYMALSIGVFLYARRGRWAASATLAALASATRSTGVVLALPIAMLYLYGPRDDRDPDGTVRPRRRPSNAGWARVLSAMLALRPRYRLRGEALWLLLVPVGLGLYMAHLALAGGDALAPFHAEAVWKRHFAGPYGGVWVGAKAAFEGLRQLLSFQRHHVYYPAAGGSPFIDAGHDLLLFAFLLAAVPATIGVLRLLPAAYGVYVLAALALPLSYPVASQPLMSLPRFLVVMFPLNMWLAIRLAHRPLPLTRAVLIFSGLAMAFFAAEFSTWHWVA